MAIYHCSVKIIGRSSGRSSVAAAAYRAAEKLTNEYDGVEHDFTKKHWVEYKEIMLPKNAPREFRDRSKLWNAVEKSEKSSNAQLAREFELALPCELNREHQIEVLKTFIEENLTSEGMCVDVVIHNPPVTNDRHQPIDENWNVTNDISKMQFKNPHAHILATMRPLDENGKWEKKSEVQYLCKRDNEEKAFTAKEYKDAKEEGWQKQFQYYEGKKKVYMTPSEAEKKGLQRVNRTPKTSPYGKKNEKVEKWNSKDSIFAWRESWERIINKKFDSIDSEIRIDSRSFKDQGREELPTLHLGTSANNIEKRADRLIHEGKEENEVVRSDIGNINRQIKEHNVFIRRLKDKIDIITKKAKEVAEKFAMKLEDIRGKLLGNKYQKQLLATKHSNMGNTLLPEVDLIEKFEQEIANIDVANDNSARKIAEFTEKLNDTSILQVAKRKDIQQKIVQEKKNMVNRNEYIQKLTKSYGLDNDNLADKKMIIQEQMKEYIKLGEKMDSIDLNVSELQNEYVNTWNAIPKDLVENVKELINKKKLETNNGVKDYLKHNGQIVDNEQFLNKEQEVDLLLNTNIANDNETEDHVYSRHLHH